VFSLPIQLPSLEYLLVTSTQLNCASHPENLSTLTSHPWISTML
jgi:hypothetical protein